MNGENWKTLLKQSCRSLSGLSEKIVLREEERAWSGSDGKGLSLLINPYFLDLAARSESIRLQCVPRSAEHVVLPVETDDPLAESLHSPLPRMVHRYHNRAAVLVTDQCAMHCRHCFRRSFTGKGARVLSAEELTDIIEYLKEHTEVEEVLLTGGDLFTLDDEPLLDILKAFRSVRKDLILRLATRIPSVLPQRISFQLAEELEALSPVWVITQFNHPDELTPESREALRRLRKGGLPIMNQTVLLKGINDSEDVLARLFQELLVQGAKPYYLFQGDLAAGTSHFRSTLDRGWEIMANLRKRISGLAMPVYAVDLPGGGGKIPLSESYLIEKTDKGYLFRNPDDNTFIYPAE